MTDRGDVDLRIQDFDRTVTVTDEKALEGALQVRYSDANSFWLTRDHDKKPAISILVRGDLACLHYFPSESHPGFVSVSSVQNPQGSGATLFFMDSPEQQQEILNKYVVPFSEALQTAREFFVRKELPSCIEWTEL